MICDVDTFALTNLNREASSCSDIKVAINRW